MRHLKTTYVKACQWKKNTGAGLLENGDGKSVVEHINKICSHHDLLESVFGTRKNVDVPVVICSTDNLDAVLDDVYEQHASDGMYLNEYFEALPPDDLIENLQNSEEEPSSNVLTELGENSAVEIEAPTTSGLSFGMPRRTRSTKKPEVSPMS